MSLLQVAYVPIGHFPFPIRAYLITGQPKHFTRSGPQHKFEHTDSSGDQVFTGLSAVTVGTRASDPAQLERFVVRQICGKCDLVLILNTSCQQQTVGAYRTADTAPIHSVYTLASPSHALQYPETFCCNSQQRSVSKHFRFLDAGAVGSSRKLSSRPVRGGSA